MLQQQKHVANPPLLAKTDEAFLQTNSCRVVKDFKLQDGNHRFTTVQPSGIDRQTIDAVRSIQHRLGECGVSVYGPHQILYRCLKFERGYGF